MLSGSGMAISTQDGLQALLNEPSQHVAAILRGAGRRMRRDDASVLPAVPLKQWRLAAALLCGAVLIFDDRLERDLDHVAEGLLAFLR